MDQLSDKELSLSIELANTQRALFQTQLRAISSEGQLATLAVKDTEERLRALFVEQEKRANAAKTASTEQPQGA